MTAIPDQILEKVLIILVMLCEDWWWDMEIKLWEQIFMLCSSVVGGIDGKGKGKSKQRDDEAKEAAINCLAALLRIHSDDRPLFPSKPSQSRYQELLALTQQKTFLPVLGQTLSFVLEATDTKKLSLRLCALETASILIDSYLPDPLVPSILPGIVSTMCKLALGSQEAKNWANGDLVEASLCVLGIIIVKSIGDDVCVREGAITVVEELEDLMSLANPSSTDTPADDTSYGTKRTTSWLRGTSSQLHIALNSLTPLVNHPSPSALAALAELAYKILKATPSTLPQSQGLLLSFLLTVSICDYPKTAEAALTRLLLLLSNDSNVHQPLLHTLMKHTRDNLSALPRLLASQADTKVEHRAGLIEAVCRLAPSATQPDGIAAIAKELGKLLGLSGGIERWGWSLLSVMEFSDPPVTATKTSAAQLSLEYDPASPRWVAFPQVMFHNVSVRTCYEAIQRMFRALGTASGDQCLPAIEWFTNVALMGPSRSSVSAMWCACRLLEGCTDLNLESDIGITVINFPRSNRLEKFIRALTRDIAQLWDKDSFNEPSLPDGHEIPLDAETSQVLHVRGVDAIHDTLKLTRPSAMKSVKRPQIQESLHRALALQLLSVSSGILQAKFSRLLLHSLYPVLHSLVSSNSFLSSSALAALQFITISTSYASPANLLMSNFDYALDGISRRLSRAHLDVDATKVFVVMIHIIGDDVITRAGDIVEECFERLDDYHGYDVVVDGLIEVLGEVVKTVKAESESQEQATSNTPVDPEKWPQDSEQMAEFYKFYRGKDQESDVHVDDTDFGPAPHTAWGSDHEEKEEDQHANDSDQEKPLTQTQTLTKQIVSRSMFFLTHTSAVIRSRILTLLALSVSVLPESALLPSIHQAWPFILNRLADKEFFVVSAAGSLIEALSTRMGSFMFSRVWDDAWPRFQKMLEVLAKADSTNSLARRGVEAVGTESAYSHSHRIYRSMLKTMTAALKGVNPRDSSVWQLLLLFRRFLHSQAHDELQACARELYMAAAANNADAVWLVLRSTMEEISPTTKYMRRPEWNIAANVEQILGRDN